MNVTGPRIGQDYQAKIPEYNNDNITQGEDPREGTKIEQAVYEEEQARYIKASELKLQITEPATLLPTGIRKYYGRLGLDKTPANFDNDLELKDEPKKPFSKRALLTVTPDFDAAPHQSKRAKCATTALPIVDEDFKQLKDFLTQQFKKSSPCRSNDELSNALLKKLVKQLNQELISHLTTLLVEKKDLIPTLGSHLEDNDDDQLLSILNLSVNQHSESASPVNEGTSLSHTLSSNHLKIHEITGAYLDKIDKKIDDIDNYFRGPYVPRHIPLSDTWVKDHITYESKLKTLEIDHKELYQLFENAKDIIKFRDSLISILMNEPSDTLSVDIKNKSLKLIKKMKNALLELQGKSHVCSFDQCDEAIFVGEELFDPGIELFCGLFKQHTP